MEKLLKGKKPPTTTKVESSPILSKVKNFLPQMKSANEELGTLDPESILVESVPADAESYIEMARTKF